MSDESLIEPFNDNEEPNCFLPSINSKSVAIVKECFYKNEVSKKLFIDIGLKEYDVYDEVAYQIIPKYSKDKVSLSIKEVVDDNKHIIDALKKANTTQKNFLISKLKYLPILVVNIIKNNIQGLCKPVNVYLSEDFTNNKDLEGFLDRIDVLSEIYFLDIRFKDIYSDNISILEELGCVTKLDIKKEINVRILSKYKNENITVLEHKNIIDLIFISQLLSKRVIYKDWNYHYIWNEINESFLFKTKNNLGQIKWKRGFECYIKTEDLSILFSNIDIFYFLDDIYLNEKLIDLSLFKMKNKLVITHKLPENNGIVIISDHDRDHVRGLNNFDSKANIEFLKEIIDSMTVEKFPILWKFLTPFYYLVNGEIESSRRMDFNNAVREIISSKFGEILKDSKWILSKNGNFFKPCEINYLDVTDNIVKESIDSQKLAEKLGIIGNFINEEDAGKALGLTEETIELAKRIENLSPEKRQKCIEKQKTLFDEINKENDINQNGNKSEIDYLDELKNKFNQKSHKKYIENDETENNDISHNPERRSQKEKQKLMDDIEFQTPNDERYIFKSIKKWELKDKQVKEFLKENYHGHCQICNETFIERNGERYFEGLYLLSRIHADWLDSYSNILCLCANCCVKFQYGEVVSEDIIEQILDFIPKKLEGNMEPILKIKLCGESKEIKFHENHLIALKTIVNQFKDLKSKK